MKRKTVVVFVLIAALVTTALYCCKWSPRARYNRVVQELIDTALARGWPRDNIMSLDTMRLP